MTETKPLDWGFTYERTNWRTQNNERIWFFKFVAILPDLSIQEVNIRMASNHPIKTARVIARHSATVEDILAYDDQVVEVDDCDGCPIIAERI